MLNYQGVIEVNVSVFHFFPWHQPEQSRPAALKADIAATPQRRPCLGDTRKLLHPWWRWWYMMINHGILGGPQLQTKVWYIACQFCPIYPRLKTTRFARWDVGKETPDFFTALFWVAYVVGPCLRFGEDVGGERLIMHPCYQHVWTVYWKVIKVPTCTYVVFYACLFWIIADQTL